MPVTRKHTSRKPGTRKCGACDDWVVAVPSYRRPDILHKKTLTTLKAAGVPTSRVYVFVANAEEEAEYRAKVDPALYNKMIVGIKGLANQRQYIMDYFPKGKLIVFMDDDIISVKKLIENNRGGSLEKVTALSSVFTNSFKVMKSHGAHIWGVYPSANPFFMSNTVSTDLKYIIGATYGIENTKDDAYRLTFGDNQEDKERTIRYWEKDGIVVRLNYITIATAYYAPGGMDTPERKQQTKEYTEKLVAKWPDYVKQIYKDKQGIYDLRFKRVKGGAAADEE